MKTTLIVWARYHRRAQLLAQHLGATLHFIHYGQRGNPVWTAIRYLVQAWRTWRMLRSEQPGIVFVQNPPIFCALVAHLYGRCYGARYVIDSHTGAFLSPEWSWSVGLHRLLSHGALTTLVHNKSQEQIMKTWKCCYLVLVDPPGDYPDGEPFSFGEGFNVVVVSSFLQDEPIEVIFEGARRLSGACFYFTGDSSRLDPRLLAKKPDNCYFTGYLPDERYIGLLRGADAVMVLTTRNHTLLCGAFESVYLGTPLITSDWPVSKDFFSQGTVHIPNTAEGICEGVRQVQREQVALKNDILRLRQRLQKEWTQQFADLQRLLQRE